MQSTTLATLLNRIDRYQDASTVEEQFKVRDLDESLRTQRRAIKPPWVVQKTYLRVFPDVLIYPVPADHDYLAYLDNQLQQGSPQINGQRNAYFTYTSLEQFYEDATPRNQLVDIWQAGTSYLGVRYIPTNAASAMISGTDVADYTNSGGAGAPFLDNVVTINGQNSIGFAVTSSPASMTEALTSFSDPNYRNKWFFRQVYFTSLPTSVVLRFGNDSSNYLGATVTAQFGGQPFQLGWNLLGFDLNITATGTLDDENFDYAFISLVGPTNGTFYLGPAYLKTWILMDYWYYSKFNVVTEGSTLADKQFFYDDSTGNYDLDDALVGDSEWIDVILFDALLTTLADNKNRDVIENIQAKRAEAWKQLLAKYPDMAPVIITSGYNFSTEITRTGFGGGLGGDLNGNGWGY